MTHGGTRPFHRQSMRRGHRWVQAESELPEAWGRLTDRSSRAHTPRMRRAIFLWALVLVACARAAPGSAEVVRGPEDIKCADGHDPTVTAVDSAPSTDPPAEWVQKYSGVQSTDSLKTHNTADGKWDAVVSVERDGDAAAYFVFEQYDEGWVMSAIYSCRELVETSAGEAE